MSVYAGWKYKQVLTLDTTSAGANVASTQSEFPVLVKLTSANHDFTQSDTNGEDLRFSNSAENAALSFEIDEWDSVAEKAFIWVRVPSVTGNDETEIKMFWGKSGQTTASSGSNTFRTADGFEAVYHLKTLSGTIADSTGRASALTNNGASSVDAQIGKGAALSYADEDHLIVPNNAWENITATGGFSLWLRINSAVTSPQEIVSVQTSGGARRIEAHTWDTLKQIIFRWADSVGGDTVTALFGATDLTAARSLLAFTHGGEQRVYRNGAEVVGVASGRTRSIGTIGWAAVGSRNRTDGQYFLNAHSVDEFRIEDVIRPADWQKLCFQNQQDTDTLITFGSVIVTASIDREVQAGVRRGIATGIITIK